MLNTAKIIKELTGIVGLYPAANPYEAGSPDRAAVHASTPLYLSGAHKLLRPDVLKELGPDLATYSAEKYDSEQTYQQLDLIQEKGLLYESQAANHKGQLITNATYWKKTTALSAWYSRIERDAIVKLAFALSMSPAVKPLLDRSPIFNAEANLGGQLSKAGQFNHWKLRLKKRYSSVTLLRVGVQVTGPLENFPIYLFHSSRTEPVAVAYLTGLTTGRTIWGDFSAPMFETEGGYYLLGYFDGDLPVGVNAVGSERTFSIEGCSSCGGIDSTYTEQRDPYLEIKAGYVANVGLGRAMTWATENTVERQTWGLNLLIDARCDSTTAILEQKEQLVNALWYIIACDVLEEMSSSTRVNGIAAEVKPQAYFALYGQQSAKNDKGLSDKRDKAVAELKIVMGSISPDCMPASTAAITAPEPKYISFQSAFVEVPQVPNPC